MFSRNEYNKSKKEFLGMSISTARSKLYKDIIFSLAKQCKKNKCHRCKKEIISIDDFSVDHLEDWMYKENARELYFNLKNISFSHLGCNSRARRCRTTVANKTGFKGVYFDVDRKGVKKYNARIGRKNIGWFEDAERAARAYDEAALKTFGERAITNEMLGLII